jgi:UvrB/uvrC motif
MHRCLAPCDGRAGPERYEELVRSLISSLSTPGGLLGTLEARLRDLAEQERFEEAALARDRLRALAEALARSRIDGWLLRTDDLVLRDEAGHRFRLRRGGLIRNDGDGPLGAPCPRERADELSALRAWVARNAVRVESSAEPFAEPVAGGAELHRLLGTLRARDRTGGARSDDG